MVGGSQLALSYLGQTTAAQNEDLNRAASTTMLFASSPGSIIGGVTGTLLTGNEGGSRTGATYGGLAEAGGTLAYGGGRMVLRELEFGAPATSRWSNVRSAIQESYGHENAADRMRQNPLFYRGVEWTDLSHAIPQRSIGGYEWLFNRPWNVSPMWATEHSD